MSLRNLGLCILLTFSSFLSRSQFVLQLHWDSPDSTRFRNEFPTRNSFSNPLERQQAVSSLAVSLADASYLSATFDTLTFDSLNLSMNINPGKAYKWARLEAGNVPEEVLSLSGARISLMTGKKISAVEVSRLMEKILAHYENNGYPFAEIGLKDIRQEEQGLIAALNLEKGSFITVDSLQIVGDVNLTQNYLSNYLQIRKGDPYNEKRIAAFDARLNDLPFLQVMRPTTVYFIEDKVQIVFYLKNRKSDQVDGIIGFAPNSENNENKLLFTGEVHLKLQNMFGTGKLLDLNWRSFLQRSQELKFRFNWPYILNSRVGVDLQFNLLKFDTLFLNLNPQLAIQYQLSGNNYIQAYYQLMQTNLLSVDTISIRQQRSFPQTSPLKTNFYGLGAHFEKLDYRLNPSKGFSSDISFAVGRRVISRNTTIEKVRFYDAARPEGYTLYDSTDLRMLQFRISYSFSRYFALPGKFVLVPSISGAHVIAPEVYYNELYRLGGVRSLRGFDEQSIYASEYALGTLELRYLFQSNSYIQVFGNSAWVKRRISGLPTLEDIPYGFGFGVNLETQSGILSLAYALGSQQDNPVELRTGKVHIGLVNYF